MSQDIIDIIVEDADPLPLAASLEKWRVSTPPTFLPVSLDEVREHLRIMDDPTSDAYVTLLIEAATRHAEEATSTALALQEITATFDVGEPIVLPRGPVRSVSSLTGAGVAGTYTMERVGTATRLIPGGAMAYPATVVYWAGYASAALIPPNIRLGILTHVGTLWEARESTSDKPRTVVPHTMDAFYQRVDRRLGVG